MGALNGALVAVRSHPFDRRNARNHGDFARRLALGARRRMGPESSAHISMVRARPERRPVRDRPAGRDRFRFFRDGLRWIAAGRAVYATGSDAEAARLAGIDIRLVRFHVFAALGALTGFAALLNSVRFEDIQANAGAGLELKVISAVVIGGASVSGGRGHPARTLLGVMLLGAIGPALTFLGVNAYWEKAVQGAIILAAVAVDAIGSRRGVHAKAAAQ